jgi:hypothetical protein
MIFINFGLKKLQENIYENKITFEKYLEVFEYFKDKGKTEEYNYYNIKYLNFDYRKYAEDIIINKITTIDIQEFEINNKLILINKNKIIKISEEYFPVLNKYNYEKQIFETIIKFDNIKNVNLVFKTNNILYEILLIIDNNNLEFILEDKYIKNLIKELINLL